MSDEPNQEEQPQQQSSSGADAVKIISDTVVGVNVRKSDNWFQAKCILVCVILFSIIGVILCVLFPDSELPWFAGALAGAFAGLVIGTFGSGIFLMIYRFIRHAQGKHD